MSGSSDNIMAKKISDLKLSDKELGKISDEDLEVKIAILKKQIKTRRDQLNKIKYRRKILDGQIKLINIDIETMNNNIKAYAGMDNSCVEDAAIEVACLKRKRKITIYRNDQKEFQKNILDGKIKILNKKIDNINIEIQECEKLIKLDIQKDDEKMDTC